MSTTASTFGSIARLRPPPQPAMGRGFVFALLAHGLLVLALSFGVQWHSDDSPAFEAELWTAVPQMAAPKAEEPPAEEPPPEPTPPQEEARAVQQAQAEAEAQAQRDADIAIAKAREDKRKKDDAAHLEQERKKREQQKLADEQAKKDKTLKEKAEREKQEKLEKNKLEKDKAEKAEKAEREKKDKAAKDAERKAAAKSEAQRQENLKRIQGMAGATGSANATGTALRDGAPSSGYGGRIKAKIRPNIIYTDSGAGNPVAEVEVRAAPDGSIIARKLLKSSGDAEWDKAVLRAVDKTEILPRDVDGRVPSLLVIKFQPRD